VASEKLVAKLMPFQRTTELDVNPLPVTVTVRPAAPTLAELGLRLDITGGCRLTWGLIVNARFWKARADVESATRTEKLESPWPAGVPEIRPVLDRANPWARLPEKIDQRYGGLPPVAASP
jgi:hypothetical protein